MAQGTTGDFFGFDIERVPDVDGDGIDDLAVGAPFTGVQSGFCRDPFFGSVVVVSSATGATLSTTLGPAADSFYGTEIDRIPDMLFDGVDEYMIEHAGLVDIFDGAGGGLLFQVPLNPGESVLSAAGDFNGDGLAWEIAIGDPSNDAVRVLDVCRGPRSCSRAPRAAPSAPPSSTCLAPTPTTPARCSSAPPTRTRARERSTSPTWTST